MREKIYNLYHTLYVHYGPQHWWPGETPFEIIVGAILTQSAAWSNVEKAITNLKKAGVLSPQALRALPPDSLAGLIRPSGYFNAKTKKLNAMTDWLERYDDNLDRVFSKNLPELRSELLDIPGIGPETADSILLYAAQKPVFVIDAYTRRILSRVGITPAVDSYDAWQSIFMNNLDADGSLFNEYHALLVRLGKDMCRKTSPACPSCCLKQACSYTHRSLNYKDF